ncbi:MAG: hypothetical protein GQ525_05515 [Draconibacterium sp.]|nr:hypothetical protein [Draconibacterium sp.]
MNQSYASSEIEQIESISANIKDTIPNKIILIHINGNDIPVKYSRKIVVGVCIDDECRLVNIELFWNITGRYLGFELPEGEFLSKTEHSPFQPYDYDLLHKLLGDPLSALAHYSIDELVPASDSTKIDIDAVSSATISAVLDYIVEGAVYTTYTLWHIVYGSSKREIEKLTIGKLNSELILKILDSNNLDDKIWVLNHIPNSVKITPELQNKFMEMISGKDIYLAERSLNALKPEFLTDDIQIKLLNAFNETGLLLKRMIIQKLKQAPLLNIEVTTTLSSQLITMNGTLVKSTLELFKLHKINSEKVLEQIAELLKNDNRYIAKQAFDYLNGVDNLNKKTSKRVERYHKKMNKN